MARAEHRLWLRIKRELDRRRPAIWSARLVASPYQVGGLPDVIIVDGTNAGQVTFVELKREDGTGILSPLQQHTHENIRAAGGRVFVVDSFEQFLSLMDWQKTVRPF